jgi:hypothetical protein
MQAALDQGRHLRFRVTATQVGQGTGAVDVAGRILAGETMINRELRDTFQTGDQGERLLVLNEPCGSASWATGWIAFSLLSSVRVCSGLLR